jgi:hypothetical protein
VLVEEPPADLEAAIATGGDWEESAMPTFMRDPVDETPAPSLEQPAIRPDPDADSPPEGDKGPGAPADDDTPDPDEYADPDAPSR